MISAKEAMKVIRKRLQTNLAANGWQTIGLTLTVRCIHWRISPLLFFALFLVIGSLNEKLWQSISFTNSAKGFS